MDDSTYNTLAALNFPKHMLKMDFDETEGEKDDDADMDEERSSLPLETGGGEGEVAFSVMDAKNSTAGRPLNIHNKAAGRSRGRDHLPQRFDHLESCSVGSSFALLQSALSGKTRPSVGGGTTALIRTGAPILGTATSAGSESSGSSLLGKSTPPHTGEKRQYHRRFSMGRKKTNPVWEYYYDLRTPDEPNGPFGVRCMYCDYYTEDRAPSNLKSHIRRNHPEQFSELKLKWEEMERMDSDEEIAAAHRVIDDVESEDDSPAGSGFGGEIGGSGGSRDLLLHGTIGPAKEWVQIGVYTNEADMIAARALGKVSKRRTEHLKSGGTKVRYRCGTWRRTKCAYQMYTFYHQGRWELYECGKHRHGWNHTGRPSLLGLVPPFEAPKVKLEPPPEIRVTASAIKPAQLLTSMGSSGGNIAAHALQPRLPPPRVVAFRGSGERRLPSGCSVLTPSARRTLAASNALLGPQAPLQPMPREQDEILKGLLKASADAPTSSNGVRRASGETSIEGANTLGSNNGVSPPHITPQTVHVPRILQRAAPHSNGGSVGEPMVVMPKLVRQVPPVLSISAKVPTGVYRGSIIQPNQRFTTPSSAAILSPSSSASTEAAKVNATAVASLKSTVIGIDTEWNLNDESRIGELSDVASAMDLLLSRVQQYHKGKPQNFLLFTMAGYSATSTPSKPGTSVTSPATDRRSLTLSDSGTGGVVVVAERMDDEVLLDRREEWKKADWVQFVYAVRGKLACFMLNCENCERRGAEISTGPERFARDGRVEVEKEAGDAGEKDRMGVLHISSLRPTNATKDHITYQNIEEDTGEVKNEPMRES